MAFPSISWFEHAACVGEPTEIFFPESGKKGDALEAERICMGCPVRKQCSEYADELDVEHGIWGGESRQQIAKTRTAKKHILVSCADCGRTMKPGYMRRHHNRFNHAGVVKPKRDA